MQKLPELQGLTPEQSKAALRYASRKSFLHPIMLLAIIILVFVVLGVQTLLEPHVSTITSGMIAGALAGLLFTIIRMPLIRKFIIEWRGKNGV